MSLRKKRIALIRLSFLPVVFLAMFVRPNCQTESTTAYCVELAGYVFLLAGLAIRIWSIFYIGGRKSHELVTEGPYSLCRNPLYVGTLLLAIGAGLSFENVLMLAAVILILLPLHLLAARWEEKHLLELFPDAFPAYAKRVPRFWPRLRNYHSPETVTVRVRAIRRIAVDTVGVLLLPEIEDLLELLHDHGLPVLLRFP
jgi:protein-S-isoprenylcysteine O-methyltransferase Ste14